MSSNLTSSATSPLISFPLKLERCTIAFMKLLISIYFYILATIQFGLLLGVYHYYRSQHTIRPSLYWMSSLVVSIVGLITFGTGIVTLTDIAHPEFNFTVANTLFFIAATLQFLFCRSLVHPIGRRLQVFFIALTITFLLVFEYMRAYGSFEMRTALMCFISITFFIFQIIQLRKKRKSTPSQQLAYLQYATTAELLFALGRFLVLVASSVSISRVDQLPQILILFTVAQMVMSALSYIAIGGYWAERIAKESARAGLENEEIRGLLIEREGLIASLLKANKTTATGALSASIAHELNQPLGASSLNIQFLQKKLAEGGIDPDLEKDILNTLLFDNQRAANIIKSLRAIFSESQLDAERVDLNELIDLVLQITKPEIQSKNIQIVLKSGSNVIANVNRGEVQQVILNLINNAIQALEDSSQTHRKMTIETQAQSNGLEFSIADNGEGVSVEHQSHLFELLSGSKKTGMGLGLWLCQHIVTRHGGRIRYEGAIGGGAQFRVFLPSETI